MKERPILFQGAMVRALLNRTKTQTRRAMKQFLPCNPEYDSERGAWEVYNGDDVAITLRCPYGSPGDRLWCRETWMPDAPRNGEWPDTAFYGCGMSPLSLIPECYRHPWHVLHRATWEGCELVGWKPSIHMPRWASRITLEVTGVRVERLQDISDADAQAEGIGEFIGGWACLTDDAPQQAGNTPKEGYRHLWERINGPGSWDANPWVWVVEFALTATSKGGA